MMTTENDINQNENQKAAHGPLEEDDEILNEILGNLKDGRKHWSDWRVDARLSYDFFAGDQWDQDDKAKLEEEERPVVTFNRIARTINAVSGLELQNRQEVRFLPRKTNDMQQNQNGTSDAGYAGMLTSAVKWVREGCDAEDEESESFQDTLICGVGWTETRIDYEEDQEGKIIIDRIDPLDMMADPKSRKRNFDDARWVAHIKDMTRKEVEELWPDFEFENSTFWNDSDISPHDAEDAKFYRNDQSDKLQKTNTVAVIHYQDFQRVNIYKVLTPEGSMIELPEDRYNAMKPALESNGLHSVKIPKRIFYNSFLIGNRLAERKQSNCDHFTFRAVTGLRHRNKNYWFGLVKLMEDPQRWANKWLSQLQHIINSNAKGGLLAEEGAASNMRKLEEDWAKPNKVIKLNAGGIERIQQREAPRFPEGVDRLLTYAIQSINDVPGVNLELIGMAERDQPYVLENSRKQAGITILASFFDALRRYRKVQGRVLAYFIREYISDGRLIRVLGQQGSQYVPLIKDAVSFQYDVIVDDSPTSPNAKEKTFNVLNQIVPMALQAGIPVPPEILDFAPLPEDLIQKWKKLISNQMSDPIKKELDDINRMMQQLAAEKLQADIQKTSADTTLSYAKADQAKAIGQDESAQAMQKIGMDNDQHQMKLEQMQKEQSRKDLEMYLTQKRKMLESQMNMQIKSKQSIQSVGRTLN